MDDVGASWPVKLALRIREFVHNPGALAQIQSVVRKRCEDRNPKQDLHAIWPDPDRDYPLPTDGAGRSDPPTLENQYVISAAFYDACWECFWRAGPKINDATLWEARGAQCYACQLARFMEKPNMTVEVYEWTLPQEQEWFLKEAIDAVRDDLEAAVTPADTGVRQQQEPAGAIVEPPSTLPKQVTVDGLTFKQFQAAMFDETDAQVFAILNNAKMSADQKMRALGRLDCRFDGYTSRKWGDVLGVTAEAVRQTDRWKELQRAKQAGPE